MSRGRVLVILVVAAGAVLVLAPWFGGTGLSGGAGATAEDASVRANIFWQIRVPRLLAAVLAGAGLAASGLALQAMFRNPLATPFTLGVSSGAAFGVTAFILFAKYWPSLGAASRVLERLTGGSVAASSLFAFAGAVAAILLAYGLTVVRSGFSTATMLLAGVAVSFFFSSLILFLQYLSDFSQIFSAIRWTMGGIDVVGFGPVWQLLPFVLVGSATTLYLTHELNLLSLGDEIAASRGVALARTKKALFFAVSITVGGVVAVCGPIGFVGMMAPHICRLLVGPDHRYLTPATLVFGGMFLALCDTFARTVIFPAEIPVGVITALLGGPFFVWLLVGGSAEKRLL